MTYRIAPESAPGDFHAAGYDGNSFETEADAENAIDELRALGGAFDIPWIVVEMTVEETQP